tara:strand:+ start:536 stop:1015 length:480 start_codon:yes stop_codon:yes gene_type:complete
MNTISEEELLALQGHVEIETSLWKKLKTRILIRTVVVMGLVLSRVLLLKFYPNTYVPYIFGDGDGDGDSGPAELEKLIISRLLVGLILAGVYLYAIMTNSYLRSVSVLSLMVPVALIWADLQMFLVSSFPNFTLIASISFAVRLLVIYLLTLNYLDIRR